MNSDVFNFIDDNAINIGRHRLTSRHRSNNANIALDQFDGKVIRRNNENVIRATADRHASRGISRNRNLEPTNKRINLNAAVFSAQIRQHLSANRISDLHACGPSGQIDGVFLRIEVREANRKTGSLVNLNVVAWCVHGGDSIQSALTYQGETLIGNATRVSGTTCSAFSRRYHLPPETAKSVTGT